MEHILELAEILLNVPLDGFHLLLGVDLSLIHIFQQEAYLFIPFDEDYYQAMAEVIGERFENWQCPVLSGWQQLPRWIHASG